MAGNPYENLTDTNPYAAEVDPEPRAPIRTGVFTQQDDPGPLGAFMIKAGHNTDEIMSGLKLRALTAQKKWYEMRGDTASAGEAQKRIEAIQQGRGEARDVMAPVEEQHPVATALGGAVPYSMPTGGVVPSMLIGGGLGATAADPGQEITGALKQGALNAGGALVGQGISGLASPGQRVMDRGVLTMPLTGEGGVIDRMRGFRSPDASGEILRAMEARGYRPLVSEIGGSTGARQAEDYFARAPGSSGVMADFQRRNQKVINTAAGETIGERARNLSASVLDGAATRIGGTFDEVVRLPGNPIGFGPDVGQAAGEVLRQQGLHRIAADPQLSQVAQYLQTLSAHRGRMTGEGYNALRSDLSAAANQAHRAGNSAAGRGYDALLEAVDGTAAQSLGAAGQGELAQRLVQARQEYSNLMSLERGRTVSAAGDVSPQALAGVMRQKYPRAFREGRMEDNALFDIARYGETYPPLRAGSPTFERQAIQDLAEAPAAVASGAERAGPSLAGFVTMPFNYLGAQALTSPVTRMLSRRGVLGIPEVSHMGGVLGSTAARDVVNGAPGSLGILSEENWR